MCGKGAVITRIKFALHQRSLAELALGSLLAVELPSRQFTVVFKRNHVSHISYSL